MSFTGDLNRFSVKVGAAHDLLAQAIAMELFGAVIMDSPVDTGRFRGNWQATIGTPASGTLDTVDPSGSVTRNAMRGVVTSLKGGGITYLANNLPYAERLEYGWSRQAPEGMVRRNVVRFQRIVDEQAAKVRV